MALTKRSVNGVTKGPPSVSFGVHFNRLILGFPAFKTLDYCFFAFSSSFSPPLFLLHPSPYLNLRFIYRQCPLPLDVKLWEVLPPLLALQLPEPPLFLLSMSLLALSLHQGKFEKKCGGNSELRTKFFLGDFNFEHVELKSFERSE